MTSPLERYLADIRDALPRDINAGDILAEIADDLRSRIDDGATEIEAIAAYGDPVVVAARYRRVQYLIGPQQFPYYLVVLRNALVITIALELFIAGIAAVLLHERSIFFAALSLAWHSAVWVTIAVTLLFALRERAGSFALPTSSQRPGALIEFIANMSMVLVMLDVPHVAATLHLVFAPAWIGVYLATIAGAALTAGSAMTYFVLPRYERLHEIVHVIGSAIVICGLAYTLARGPGITPSSPGLAISVFWTLIAAIAIFAINIVTSVRSLTKQRHLILDSLQSGNH